MTAEKYNECVGLYADALYRFILKNIREPEDARDVVQNAFEALWINRNEVNPEKIKSWLFTVAYHKMIDFCAMNNKQAIALLFSIIEKYYDFMNKKEILDVKSNHKD